MAKAEELSKACSPSSEGQGYKFTIGWLDGFKKRYHIRLRDSPTSKSSTSTSTSEPRTSPLDVKPAFPGFFLPPPYL